MLAVAVVCALAGQGPDRDLVFTREAPTSLSAETLKQTVWSLNNWPRWFHSLNKAERMDIAGRPFPQRDQSVETGALIRLEIRPHRGERRGSFELLTRVVEYDPGKTLMLQIVEDRSGRVFKLFDRLLWKIELLPGGQPIIRGTETVRTRSWRARVLSRLAERIVLNQLFYPDIMALAEFTQPLGPNPYPVYGQ